MCDARIWNGFPVTDIGNFRGHIPRMPDKEHGDEPGLYLCGISGAGYTYWTGEKRTSFTLIATEQSVKYIVYKMVHFCHSNIDWWYYSLDPKSWVLETSPDRIALFDTFEQAQKTAREQIVAPVGYECYGVLDSNMLIEGMGYQNQERMKKRLESLSG